MSLATACVRTAPTPVPTYWVSSDSSLYSPTIRLRVATVREGSTIVVALDSGIVAVPGTFAPGSPVMMRDLYMTAYVAESNTSPMALVRADSARFADRRGWRAVAESDSVPLIDQLRYGERQAIRAVRLQLRNVPGGAGEWLVLGVSGQSVDLDMPFDERDGLRAGAPGGRRFQVYACSNRDLTGQLDTARANEMRRAYGLAS